jgi:hypothetical protein
VSLELSKANMEKNVKKGIFLIHQTIGVELKVKLTDVVAEANLLDGFHILGKSSLGPDILINCRARFNRKNGFLVTHKARINISLSTARGNSGYGFGDLTDFPAEEDNWNKKGSSNVNVDNREFE